MEGLKGKSKQTYYFHRYVAQSTEMKALHTVASLKSIEQFCSI